jgi:cyclopropane fatty-acyl-phospholipid synthase-like methyltransferase
MNLLRNPLNPFLWAYRRNEHDINKLYNFFSDLMHITTNGYFLNFGFWSDGIKTPIQAQRNLCSFIEESGDLHSAKTVLDIGSGFSWPAIYWKSLFDIPNIICVDINMSQLRSGVSMIRNCQKEKIIFYSLISTKESKTNLELLHYQNAKGIHSVNATSTKLPFANNSVDRIVALESAQHFRPLGKFFMECKRVLEINGVMVVAIPVIYNNRDQTDAKNMFSNIIPLFIRLGILSFTWTSEHYGIDYVKALVAQAELQIKEIKLIGSCVYEPLSDYYIQNREKLRNVILESYPSYIEKILYKSVLKMKELSEERVIEYAIIKVTGK